VSPNVVDAILVPQKIGVVESILRPAAPLIKAAPPANVVLPVIVAAPVIVTRFAPLAVATLNTLVEAICKSNNIDPRVLAVLVILSFIPVNVIAALFHVCVASIIGNDATVWVAPFIVNADEPTTPVNVTGATNVGPVLNTARLVPVSSVNAVSKLADENEPNDAALPTEVTIPVRLALVVTFPAVSPAAVPVTLVITPDVGVPKIGAMNVGVLLNTNRPDPVSSDITPNNWRDVVAPNCANVPAVVANPVVYADVNVVQVGTPAVDIAVTA